METMAPRLSERQRKHLRGLAHGLRPVARLGNAGVTDAFLAELDAALKHHELIKLKVETGSRDGRSAAIDAILARTEALLVTRIGNVAVLYRPAADHPRVIFPD